MITRQVDEGRVILWAGPVDREWGDLVLRPDFVPLVGETLRYLTQENTGMLLSKPLGGELSVDLNGAGPFTAISPQGMSVVLSRSEASEGERHTRGWQLKGLTEVGHHKITAPVTSESVVLLERDSANEGEQVARRFVVHLDPRLSELRSEIEDETEEAKSASPLVGALAQRSELWHIGLIGLFILALLEGITLYQRREDRVGVITR